MFLFSNPQKAHPCVEPRRLTASFLETGYSTVVSSLTGSIGNSLSLSLRFNFHFRGEPGLAGFY